MLSDAALELAARALAEAGPVDGVGIATQRASTVVWDRATGVPVGPALGWQDLRTIGECLVHQGDGMRFAPNQSATKLAWLLDTYDPDRSRDLCFGTPDTWIAWSLSQGEVHVTDLSNAAVTGLVDRDGTGWHQPVLDRLRIPAAMLPTIVDSSAQIGAATALAGAPPIAGILGDQQASMLGQGVVVPGPAKITFGTGGMLDVVVGPQRPGFDTRGGGGTFPIVAWRRQGRTTWGLEAIMLSAGTNVEWLRDDLQILSQRRGVPRRGRPVRDQRRRGLRAGPARVGHPQVGLRGPRHAAGPDPGIGPAPGGAGGAGRGGPARRGPGRRGRARRPAEPWTRCGSTAA